MIRFLKCQAYTVAKDTPADLVVLPNLARHQDRFIDIRHVSGIQRVDDLPEAVISERDKRASIRKSGAVHDEPVRIGVVGPIRRQKRDLIPDAEKMHETVNTGVTESPVAPVSCWADGPM